MKTLLTGLFALAVIVIVAGSLLLPASAAPGTQGNCLAAALPNVCVTNCVADLAATCAAGFDMNGDAIDTNLCAQTIAINVAILVALPPAGPVCAANIQGIVDFCAARAGIPSSDCV